MSSGPPSSYNASTSTKRSGLLCSLSSSPMSHSQSTRYSFSAAPGNPLLKPPAYHFPQSIRRVRSSSPGRASSGMHSSSSSSSSSFVSTSNTISPAKVSPPPAKVSSSSTGFIARLIGRPSASSSRQRSPRNEEPATPVKPESAPAFSFGKPVDSAATLSFAIPTSAYGDDDDDEQALEPPSSRVLNRRRGVVLHPETHFIEPVVDGCWDSTPRSAIL